MDGKNCRCYLTYRIVDFKIRPLWMEMLKKEIEYAVFHQFKIRPLMDGNEKKLITERDFFI